MLGGNDAAAVTLIGRARKSVMMTATPLLVQVVMDRATVVARVQQAMTRNRAMMAAIIILIHFFWVIAS